MYNYYCKNCNNIIGKWNYVYEEYKIATFCYRTESNNIDSIYFLDCKKCNKFVCENCFEENKIIGEKNLYKWFFKYKKIVPIKLNHCKICKNKYDFRWQHWFFKELTFYK